MIDSFLLGFVFPPLWYYATFLYFGNYYRRDPRERAGLAASAITVSTRVCMHINCGKIIYSLKIQCYTDAGDGMFSCVTRGFCSPLVLLSLR